MLGLERDTAILGIDRIGCVSAKPIARIDLQAGLIGFQRHPPSRAGMAEFGDRTQSRPLQNPAMIVSVRPIKLPVGHTNVAADRLL